MSELSTEEIIHSYFEQKNILAKHQIESYNDYVDNIIPNIIDQYSPIKIEINNENIKNIILTLQTETLYIDNAKYIENNGVQEILTRQDE